MDPSKPSTSKDYCDNLFDADESAAKIEDRDDKCIDNANNEELNETLEVFAKTYNLTAQNVKNIIFHVVKNPKTFSTLIGKDPEAIGLLRMTRARQKELERLSNVKLDIELKPVNAPRTFLDVDYGEDDDEDADYRPETEDNENADLEPEDDESEFPNEFNPNWGELVQRNDTMPDELLTSVDDPEYLNFLKSVQAPNFDIPTDEDEVEDDEFNILQQMEDDLVEEEEEFRMDRTTKIPRWELNALRQDWVFPKNHSPMLKQGKRFGDSLTVPPSDKMGINVIEESTSFNKFIESAPSEKRARFATGPVDNDLMSTFVLPQQDKTGQSDVDPEIIEVFSTVLPQPTVNQEKIHDAESISCSLLSSDICFQEEELKILKIQLEKHELDNEMYTNEENSIFNISNLPDAVYSCHDILACKGVELPSSMSSSYYLSPKNEVMWVFGRSKALKYPQLVSDVRFEHFEVSHSVFLPSEQILLSLALFELFEVKHSSWNNCNGKYQMLAHYFLPTKTVTQIRNHLKNVRASPSTPIHAIITEAQHNGVLNAKFVLDSVGNNAQLDAPINWPKRFQPEWLKNLSVFFAKGTIQVLPNTPPRKTTENTKEFGAKEKHFQLNSDSAIVDPKLSAGATSFSSKQNDNLLSCETLKNLSEKLPYNDNLPDVDIGVGSEEVSNDVPAFRTTNDVTTAETDDVDVVPPSNDNLKHKSRRKIRVEKCVDRLCSFEAREETKRALIEAVNHDFKQRLFMHQDKLKEIQTIILRKDLNIAEIFDQLSKKLQGKQHAHVLSLIASLAPNNEFLPNLPVLNDLNRTAYKNAFEIIVNIYTYLTGCRNSTAIRNAFKNIKEVIESNSDVEICNRLKHHFGSREDSLWRILRTQIPNEKFNEKIEEWQYEFIDMDKLQENASLMSEENLKFETMNLPYKFDPTERDRLRLRHGRLTMEHKGRLKTVNVGFTTERDGKGGGPVLPTTAAPWTREDDKLLLLSFQKFHGNVQKTIDEFLSLSKTNNSSALEASRRLTFLMGVLKNVQSKE